MKLNKFQKDILRFIGIKTASFFINVLLKTVIIEIKNGEPVSKLLNEKKNFVVAFWHGSMLIGWYIHRSKNFSALISKSKDGDVLASILKKWRFHVVRGSSHIGGKEALELMIDLTKQNFSIAITPDGPTGPIYEMKAGAVVTAKKSNIPLLLVGIGMKKKYVMKSWDKFEIPKPFTKAEVIYSDLIYIENSLSYDETNQKIFECATQLNLLQKEASKTC